MELPIDARKAPFKDKYIDEETPLTARWYIFGVHRDGTVDITDGTNDVFTGLTLKEAEILVKARNEFVDRVLFILNNENSARVRRAGQFKDMRQVSRGSVFSALYSGLFGKKKPSNAS